MRIECSPTNVHIRDVFTTVSRLVSWLDCSQDYAKTSKEILIKLCWRTGKGPRKNTVKFGIDLDKGMYSGILIQGNFWAWKRYAQRRDFTCNSPVLVK